LDIIERAIQLRTNPGENVFTPFMGVGSEVLSAVRLGRRGIGTELKTSYFRQAVKNMGWEEPAKDEPDDMFAGMEDDELELME
jgi:DNA modification methylase